MQFDAAMGTAEAATPAAAAAAAATAVGQHPMGGPLQHIHHTSLGLVGVQEGRSADDLLHPGPHTRPPTAPR